MSMYILAATLTAKEVYLDQYGARKRATSGCRAVLSHVSGGSAVHEGQPPNSLQLDETGAAVPQDWEKEGVLEGRANPVD